MPFPGYTDSDFDAYLPARAGSNAYNLPRLEVQQKTLGLARALRERAPAEAVALEVRASDAAPTLWNRKQVTEQWVFLWRDAAARQALEELLDRGRSLAATLTDPTPFTRHAFLALRVDPAGVEVCLRVPGEAWVDARNLRALCQDAAAGESLAGALGALPPGFRVSSGAESVGPAEADRAALERLTEGLEGSERAWSVSLAVPRPEAVAAGSQLLNALESAFGALLALYRRVAWSADNDRVSALSAAASAHAEREAHLREEAAREAAWKAEHDQAIERRREAAAVEARERASSHEPVRPSAVQAAVQPVVEAARREAEQARRESDRARLEAEARDALARAAQIRPARRAGARPETKSHTDVPAHSPRAEAPAKAPRPEAPRAVREDSEAAVALGTRVKVCAGPFAGRVGTVTELDGRGAKVAFGLLSARVEASDLVRLVEG